MNVVTPPSELTLNAREVVAVAVARAAEEFRDMTPREPDVAALDERGRALATAIHRTVLQRWLTLEYLLDLHLRQPLHNMEPLLQGVLLTGAAQLIFMDRLPRHAVVDEAVSSAKRLVREGAAGVVNAVLRKVAALPEATVYDQTWTPAADRLPLEHGWIPLSQPCLPDPAKKLDLHLTVATSHPRRLVRRWLAHFGPEETTRLCWHGTFNPPVVVALGGDTQGATQHPVSGAVCPGEMKEVASLCLPSCDTPSKRLLTPFLTPHGQPGFAVFEGSHDQLVTLLAADPARRVQDVAAARPIVSTAKLVPRLILDYCAGRGTKTRQLAALHPNTDIIATDSDPVRLATLRQALADRPRVTVTAMEQLPAILGDRKVDLLLLDVPCSNSAVIARRPEARYRFGPSPLHKLTVLQQQIIDATWHLLAPGGHLLYATCSLELEENTHQIRRVVAQYGATLLHEELLMPCGSGTAYQDGSYHALLQRPA